MDRTIVLTLISGIAVPVVGYMLYKWRAQVDVERRKEEAPLAVLERAIAQRDAQLSQFLGAHMENDRQDRDRLIKTLTAIEGTLTNLNSEMLEHRAEERERTAKIHDRFHSINDKLSEIKGQGARRFPNGPE